MKQTLIVLYSILLLFIRTYHKPCNILAILAPISTGFYWNIYNLLEGFKIVFLFINIQKTQHEDDENVKKKRKMNNIVDREFQGLPEVELRK